MNKESNSTSERIDQCVADYLSQQISPQDTQYLWQWVSESEENRAYFLALQEVWFGTSTDTDKEEKRFDKEKAFSTFWAKVKAEGHKNKEKEWKKPQKSPFKRKKLWGALGRIAAVALLILGIAYGSFRYGEERLQNRFADMTIEAPLGSRIQFQLPDGSSVALNSGSKAIYSQGFGVNERRIALVGEGYFEVERNEKLPFTVQTDDIEVKVLGTKFNFTNYPDESEASVSLIEGKVGLSQSSSHKGLCTLLPNESAVYDKATGQVVVKKRDTRKSNAWTTGELYFDEERLDNIVRILERSYNVSIKIADEKAAAMRFYGAFGRIDHSVEQVLDALSSTRKINYRQHDGAYQLSSNNNN